MTTPRNNVVRLRLTELEREAWSEAAGGKGKLSEWIRATCNASALTEGGGDGDSGARTQGVTGITPAVSLDAVATEGAKVSFETPQHTVVTKPLRKEADCPRWMHHRKGTYCGTCKKVQ